MKKTYRFILTAISPVHHGGDLSKGSEVPLRRMKFQTPEGIQDLPFIHGNALRGKARRLLAKDMLYNSGIILKTQKMYQMLHMGGSLEEGIGGEGSVDISLREKILEIPFFKVFGCSVENQLIPSAISFSLLYPVAHEFEYYLPEEVKNYAKDSVFDFLDWVYQTRKDDREIKEREETLQMILRTEVFIPGTKFYGEIIIENLNEIEESLVGRMFELLKESPIGGKGAIGLGKVKWKFLDKIPESKIYLEEVKKEEFKKKFEKLEDILVGRKKKSEK